MSILEKNIQLNVNYNNKTRTTNTVKVLGKQAEFNKKAKTDTSNQPQPDALVQLSILALTKQGNDDNSVFEEESSHFSPELLQQKLILEKFFGKKINIKKQLDLKVVSHNIASENQNIAPGNQTEVVTINNKVFLSDDWLQVTQTHMREQTLNFNLKGEFGINNKNFNVDYQFNLTEKQSSISQIEVSAIQLKDPLIIQYGSASLSGLNGETSQIDINQDQQKDSLPMFSGNVGYLVHDKNQNGQADNGTELFGPNTGSGFNELSKLDQNNNGFIDPEDKAFDKLYIWHVNDSGDEVWIKLSDTKIEGILLNSTETPFNFFDKQNQLQAKMTHSSIALSNSGDVFGVHEIDIRV
ncbi:hypothetical protein [Pseudoalteromonas denitrificans]|uniref:VCBS repeat-containing protein n=1 Tax=Pseudoalteromonas denitrificans DSM 6059 TaxID=1123010 RepID=A0A1I1P3E1_9GAMM|nr:hypothetical protein [Pseudoalteromonas denitrificans]SFD04082.1 hypothetical protein SAMN02745724_03272 [Pseudoalteromonas denitrificans DSM 6059]